MVSVAGCCWLSWMDCPYQHLQIFGRRGIKLLLFFFLFVKSWCRKWSLWFQHLFKAINVIPLVLKAGHTWSFSSINLYRLIMYPCFQLWQYDFELVFVKNNHEFVHENMKKPEYECEDLVLWVMGTKTSVGFFSCIFMLILWICCILWFKSTVTVNWTGIVMRYNCVVIQGL